MLFAVVGASGKIATRSFEHDVGSPPQGLWTPVPLLMIASVLASDSTMGHSVKENSPRHSSVPSYAASALRLLRRRLRARPWSWQTRDSEISRIREISFIVISSL